MSILYEECYGKRYILSTVWNNSNDNECDEIDSNVSLLKCFLPGIEKHTEVNDLSKEDVGSFLEDVSDVEVWSYMTTYCNIRYDLSPAGTELVHRTPSNLDRIYARDTAFRAVATKDERNVWVCPLSIYYSLENLPQANRSGGGNTTTSISVNESREENTDILLQTFDEPARSIVKLLLVLHGSFKHELQAEEWQNSQLIRKSVTQLEQPLHVASGALPSWLLNLSQMPPTGCGFLFSFGLRRRLFAATAFGTHRSLHRVQEELLAYPGNSSSAGESAGQTNLDVSLNSPVTGHTPQGSSGQSLFRMSVLKREMIRVRREYAMEWAEVFLNTYKSRKASMEVTFLGEQGSGLGVTREFFSLVSIQMQQRQRQYCEDLSVVMNKIRRTKNDIVWGLSELGPNGPREEVHKKSDFVYETSHAFPSFGFVWARIDTRQPVKVYYELHVIKPGLAQVGWASQNFSPNSMEGEGAG